MAMRGGLSTLHYFREHGFERSSAEDRKNRADQTLIDLPVSVWSARFIRLALILAASNMPVRRYGPLVIAIVMVVVYVPGSVLGGIVTLTIIDSPNFPRPELAAALKNFTGGGGGLPAGISKG